MNLAISRRDRRVLLAGAAVIASILLLSRGVPAWRAWEHEVRASAAELTAEAERAEASVQLLPQTLDTLEQRQGRLVALAPVLLGGESPAAAAGALASLVSGAAAQSHMELAALRLQVDSARTGVFTRIAVRGDATGDIRGVTQLLLTLERGPHLLAVRELSISQPEPAAPAHQPEALRIEFVVEGLGLNRQEASP